MKSFLAMCLTACLTMCLIVAAAVSPAIVAAADSPARPVAAGAGSVTGEVLEVKDVDSYTYLRLKLKDGAKNGDRNGETWAAVGKAPIKKGTTVTIENVMVMDNFESKALKKTFTTILFGTLADSAGGTRGAASDMAAAHAGVAKVPDAGDINVAKATGPNARTVAEIVTKSADLNNKPVLVRGKVVKYNPGIMGKNWIHLRDGSGAAADNSNDVLVTTASAAKVGDVVSVKGVVRTNKDFGSGYSYKVLVEDATLAP